MLTEGALEGIRVLDATQMLAGPLCTMRLGDLGAEVVKIEPLTGEWTRSHGFANADIHGETNAFLGLNRNKKSVAVDLKTEKGLEIFYKLVEQSDVFIQNYRPGTADRLGMGYDKLSQINPRLVYCSISGYGEEGPYAATRPGQDLIIQGYSGSLFSVGKADDPPIPGALWAIDSMTGYQAAIGILAALFARGRNGKGQKVAVNMLACAMDCQSQELMTYLNMGIMPQRSKSPFAHAMVTAPYGIYKTKDAWLVISQSPLHILGEALDSDRLREMTDWNDGALYRDEIYEIVSAITPTKTTAEWIALFDSYKLWCGPVYTYKDLENDPHVQATKMFTSVEHPKAGVLRMPDVPIKMSETPGAVRMHPPLLGEHTEQVLRDLLGYADDQITALRGAGVIL